MNLDFQNASASFKRKNPHLFGVGAVASAVAEQPAVRSLVKNVSKPTRSSPTVEVSVELIALRRRLLDEHDNSAFSQKPLVDAIAESLGIDDADKRIKWIYGQVKTSGPEGVIVRISV